MESEQGDGAHRHRRTHLGSAILAAQPEGEPTAFRPEFLNRLDEMILFRRLQRADMAAIVQIQLAPLRKLLEDRKIGLELDRGALEWPAREDQGGRYATHPLARVTQCGVRNSRAQMTPEDPAKQSAAVDISAGAGGLPISGRSAAAASTSLEPGSVRPHVFAAAWDDGRRRDRIRPVRRRALDAHGAGFRSREGAD